MALAMVLDGAIFKEREGEEEHEEGEISDEEPLPHSSESEEQVDPSSLRVTDGAEAVELHSVVVAATSAAPQPSSERDPPPPLLRKRVSLEELMELGSSSIESRSAFALQSRKRDAYAGRPDVDASKEDDVGNSRKRSDWGAYGSNLYNFAWAQAVSGRPSNFASGGDSPSLSASSKVSTDGLSSSGSGGMSSWSSTDNHKKLSREYSRELELPYGRSLGRSSEERDDMSPLRENGSSRTIDRISAERDAANRGRRLIRETSWSGRTERFVTVKSRMEKSERGLDDHRRGDFDSAEGRLRKQLSDSQSPNGRVDEADESRGRSPSEGTVQLALNGIDNCGNEDREEGELEEGEIELGSLPESEPKPASPPSMKELPNSNRQQDKYGGFKAVEYWAKEKDTTRPLSSKTQQSRSQVDEYSSRNRHRQTQPQISPREKRLSQAGDLLKNVTVKDAQKSFVDVCGRLHKALRVLDELHPLATPRQAGLQESLPREITAVARQAFAGIRAVYAVRNTASGREQERDKNIFPRLLELANGYCQKLFTPKQTRELEVMMQTIANAGRLVRDGAEKGQQLPRDQQFQPAPNKKSNDNDEKLGNKPLGDKNMGSIKTSASGTEVKSSSETSIAGRILGVVDAKQAGEAAAIAAAALAYAQSSAAARANNSFGSTFDNRMNGTSVQTSGQGVSSWGGLPSVQQFSNSGVNAPLQLNSVVYHSVPTGNKYQPQWNAAEQRPIQLGQDVYNNGPFVVEAKANETPAPGPTLLPGKGKDELNVPTGYAKSAGSAGMLPEEWEALSPPGSGMSNYGRLPGALQTINKDSSRQRKVWPSRPEMGTVLAYQNSRGNAPSPYPPELLMSLNHQGNGANANMYSTERLPSPTPDEDDSPSVPPSLETKPGSLDKVGSKEPNVTTQPPQAVSNLPTPMLSPGTIHNLIRTQSLDGPGQVMEQRIQKGNSGDLSALSATRALEQSESVKNGNSIGLPGNFRSRDPRRRFHNNSVDLTDVGGMGPASQVTPRLSLSPGETVQQAEIDTKKKRLAPSLDDKQDVRAQKRVKGQSDNSFDINGFSLDSLHAIAGTGGWLDDNVVPSFTAVDDLPIAMDVDEEIPSIAALEGGNGFGGDAKVGNAENQLDVFAKSSNNVAMNKQQRVDVGQQTGESGQRKMKPRDPRRMFVDTPVENGSSGDTVKADGIVASDPRKATGEYSSWTDKEVIKASKQGANITPHGTVGMDGSPSLQIMKSDQIVNSEGGQVVSAAVTEKSVTDDSLDIEVMSVSTESISQELPEQQKDKSTSAIVGPRKTKGNPSQWGASQVHPHLEQLLGDLSEEDRRTVQLERQRRMEEQDRMFSAGKLCLVLDLDHTLLNSAKFSEIESEWDQRLRVAEAAERNRTARDGVERRELYRFPHMSMWTKLRPGIWKFLARASQLYELHVYTMGNRVYATEMAKLLDPTGKLFAGRVISKGDDGDGDDLLPKSKDLDGVLGMESAVVIIDDSARVWPHHSENLIVVERYMYFPCSRRQFGLAGPSLLEVGHDERETDGMLASALGVIDKIHQSFFKNPRLREVDVREILAAQQRSVLAGCKVVFSRVFPVGEAEPHRHPLWRTAEQFGAICTIAIDDQVTHVVAISLGTDKVNWALESGRYVVRPAWLEASTILYRRANERDFPVVPQ